MVYLWRLFFLVAAAFFLVAALKLPSTTSSPTFWYYLGFVPAFVGAAAYGWPASPPKG